MNAAERAARRYCRKVRSWLPGGKMRRYVMTQIRETVQEFVREHPDADDAAILAQLGTPQEIAAAYVENTETIQQHRRSPAVEDHPYRLLYLYRDRLDLHSLQL